jgi:hypothetical protein
VGCGPYGVEVEVEVEVEVWDEAVEGMGQEEERTLFDAGLGEFEGVCVGPYGVEVEIEVGIGVGLVEGKGEG